MDEKTRRQIEQAALAKQDKEREERRRKEDAERKRRNEEHERYRMQQMAIEKQNAGRKKEELEIAKKNDAMLDALEKKKEEDRMNKIFGNTSQDEF